MRGVWRKQAPAVQLLLFAGIIMISACIFMFLGFLLAIPFFGVNLFINPPANYLNDPDTLPLLKFLQVCSQLGMMILPAIIAAFLFSLKPWQYLHLNRKPDTRSIVLVFISILCSLPLINFLLQINGKMELPGFLSGLENRMKDYELRAKNLTEVFLNDISPQQLAINFFMIAVLPAIGEELLFRGVFQKLFIQMTRNKIWSVIITGALFSAIHLQFYGFLPRFLLGVFFGLLLIWSNNIWLPIAAHFANNFMSLLLSTLYKNNSLNFNPDTIGTNAGDAVWVIASTLIIVFCAWKIFRIEKTNRLTPEET